MKTIIIIFVASWSVFLLLAAFHHTMQAVMGYQWWYRRIYLYTPHWRFTRRVKFFFSGHVCEVCRRRHYTHPARMNLDIHHKTYRHLWWEWLHLKDLEVLCRFHHTEEHEAEHVTPVMRQVYGRTK